MTQHVIVFGGTGVIGQRVVKEMASRGWDVAVIGRGASREVVGGVRVEFGGWEGWEKLLRKDSVLVNLAGENPGKQWWTESVMENIRKSRLDAIYAIKSGVERADNPPGVIIQASAAGIYGSRGDTVLTEDDVECVEGLGLGGRFRVGVCKEIEKAIRGVGVPWVAMRVGHPVLSEGGLLGPLNLVNMLGVGRIGSGGQYLPWVHQDDVARGVHHVAVTPSLHNTAINMSSPNPVTLSTFLATLSRIHHRPHAILPIPSSLLPPLVGPSSSVVTDSIRQHPTKLHSSGFEFLHPHLEPALRDFYNL